MLTKGIVFEGQSYWSPDSLVAPPVATLADMSRYKNHGTIIGATWVRLPSGLWVLSFDGDDSVSRAGKITKALSGTIIAWFNITTWVSQGSLLAYGGASLANYGFLSFELVNPNIRVTQRTDGNATIDTVRGGTSLSLGVWFCAALVSNGTAYSIYVNGTAESLTVVAGANSGDWFGDTICTAPDFTTCGRRYLAGTYYDGHIGLIGKVRCLNRDLSAGQILALFESERSLFGV